MDQYETLLAQAINKLDNVTVPVAFMSSIGIPVAQASNILHAIYNDIQMKKKKEKEAPEATDDTEQKEAPEATDDAEQEEQVDEKVQ